MCSYFFSCLGCEEQYRTFTSHDKRSFLGLISSSYYSRVIVTQYFKAVCFSNIWIVSFPHPVNFGGKSVRVFALTSGAFYWNSDSINHSIIVKDGVLHYDRPQEFGLTTIYLIVKCDKVLGKFKYKLLPMGALVYQTSQGFHFYPGYYKDVCFPFPFLTWIGYDYDIYERLCLTSSGDTATAEECSICLSSFLGRDVLISDKWSTSYSDVPFTTFLRQFTDGRYANILPHPRLTLNDVVIPCLTSIPSFSEMVYSTIYNKYYFENAFIHVFMIHTDGREDLARCIFERLDYARSIISSDIDAILPFYSSFRSNTISFASRVVDYLNNVNAQVLGFYRPLKRIKESSSST